MTKTRRELKRIQTFGDGFILHGSKREQIMQIGNSVAPRFAYHLGEYSIEMLSSK